MFTANEQFILETVKQGLQHSAFKDVDRVWVSAQWALKFGPTDANERFGCKQTVYNSTLKALIAKGSIQSRKKQSKTFYSIA